MAMLSSMTSSTWEKNRSTTPSIAITHGPRRPMRACGIDEAFELKLLAEVARWNDQSAFDEIHAHHHDAVRKVALSVCRNAYIAEEIVQHAFLALWKQAQRLADENIPIRPWITTVARNAAIDQMRRQRNNDALNESERILANEDQPDESVLKAEETAELSAAIATLSTEQRIAVELVFFEGMTYQSAAEKACEPIGTIKSRVKLALKHLRRRMARSG